MSPPSDASGPSGPEPNPPGATSRASDGPEPDGREPDTGEAPALDGVLTRVDRWSERVSFELFRFGIYVTMPALVVLVSLDVTLRYVFNAPLQWARDVNGLLLLITIFSALPHAWDRAYHIRMEVFYARFSRETKRIADVLSSLAGVLFFGLMAFQGARFVPFMMQTGETGEDLDFPLWPFMGVLALCAVVTVARVFSNPEGTEERLRHPSVAGGDGSSDADGPDDEDEGGGPNRAASADEGDGEADGGKGGPP